MKLLESEVCRNVQSCINMREGCSEEESKMDVVLNIFWSLHNSMSFGNPLLLLQNVGEKKRVQILHWDDIVQHRAHTQRRGQI